MLAQLARAKKKMDSLPSSALPPGGNGICLEAPRVLHSPPMAPAPLPGQVISCSLKTIKKEKKKDGIEFHFPSQVKVAYGARYGLPRCKATATADELRGGGRQENVLRISQR